ncbi:MAG: hypothetical protein ABIP33_00935 [Pseudolysinimonas sp.]
MKIRSGSALALLVVIGLALTACTGYPSSTASPTASPTSSTPAPSPSTESPTPTSTPTSASKPVPPQVVGLTTHAGAGSGEVSVTWTQSSDADVMSYIVYRALAPGGTPTKIGTASRHDVTLFPAVPFDDEVGAVGYYRVGAVDSAGQRGPLSDEVCGAAPGQSC